MRGLKKHCPMPLPCHCHAMLQLRTEPQRNGLTRNCCRLPSPATFQLSLWPLPNTHVPSEYEIKASRHLPSHRSLAWNSGSRKQLSRPFQVTSHQIVEHPKLPGIPPLHALHALPCWYSSRLQLSKPRRRHTKRITSTCCKLEVRHPKTRKRRTSRKIRKSLKLEVPPSKKHMDKAGSEDLGSETFTTFTSDIRRLRPPRRCSRCRSAPSCHGGNRRTRRMDASCIESQAPHTFAL